LYPFSYYYFEQPYFFLWGKCTVTVVFDGEKRAAALLEMRKVTEAGRRSFWRTGPPAILTINTALSGSHSSTRSLCFLLSPPPALTVALPFFGGELTGTHWHTLSGFLGADTAMIFPPPWPFFLLNEIHFGLVLLPFLSASLPLLLSAFPAPAN